MCTEVAYLQIFSERVLQTLNQISQILYCKFPTNKVEKEFLDIFKASFVQHNKQKIKIDMKQIFRLRATESMIDHIQVHISISRYIFVHFYPDILLKHFGCTKMEILYFAMIKTDRKLTLSQNSDFLLEVTVAATGRSVLTLQVSGERIFLFTSFPFKLRFFVRSFII